ncbi:MAG: TIGR02996 domain-containing protein [Alphaproteobacteria bacterium]|nr:TIGR02996 domain-containing protein [Alphaproteobacteria bacterium]
MDGVSDIDGFFDRLSADPASDDLREVFADWLREQDREDEADWVRMEAAHARSALDVDARKRFVELDKAVDPAFRARVARLRVEPCIRQLQAEVFEYACPERWEDMQATKDPLLRTCSVCDKAVHFVSTVAEARQHANLGHCVAISPAEPRLPGDLVAGPPPVPVGPPQLQHRPLAGAPMRPPPEVEVRPDPPPLAGKPAPPPSPVSWWKRLIGWD